MKYPSHLEIEITNHCQLKCPFCPHKIMTRKQGFMSWWVLRKIIEESKGKTKTCYLHMIGEPLLHPDLINIINYVSNAGIRTSISSNSILLSETMSKLLFSSKLDELTLALDSLNKKTFEKLRIGAKFETVLNNIDKCLKIRKTINSKTRLELQVIVMKENEKEIPLFEKKYKPMLEGIGKLLIKGYSTFAGKVPDKSPEKTLPRRFTCGKLNTSTAILWNGDMVYCCRDYNGITKVGNVLENSIAELWEGEMYQKYRKVMKNKNWKFLPLCKNC